MNNSLVKGNEIGEIKKRCEVGLKGKTKVTWLACKVCGFERWVMPNYIEKNICSTCFKRQRAYDIHLNSFVHKETCKCRKCRMGRGYFKGSNNPMWRGGRKVLKSGYVYVYLSPDSEFSSMISNGVGQNYVAEHRLIMAMHLKRNLTKEETVHHINGIKSDNRIENLELWSSRHHSGQRVEDQIKWAIEILTKNNYKVEKL